MISVRATNNVGGEEVNDGTGGQATSTTSHRKQTLAHMTISILRPKFILVFRFSLAFDIRRD